MADSRGCSPFLRCSFPSWFQTLWDFLTLQKTARQSSSDQSKIPSRYLKVSTPSLHYASSSPVRLNIAPLCWLTISTSFLCHRICVFLLHRFVRWFFWLAAQLTCAYYTGHSRAAAPSPLAPPLFLRRNVCT